MAGLEVLKLFFFEKIVFSFISLSLSSSCLFSSLLSSSLFLSRLLFSCLSSSLCLSRLLFSCLVLSFFLCLSVSLSLSLSPCGVVCCGVVWCVWIQKRLRVCIQNVPVYADTTRTCVSTCARGARTHRDVLNLHTKGVLYIHTGEQGVIVCSASQILPTYGCHVLQSFTKEIFGSFPCSSMRIDLRTTCPRFLQSFALLDKAVQFTCTPSHQISCDTCA